MPESDPLKLLVQLRDQFIDDIPPDELTTNVPNYAKYKCRSAFFGLVGEILSELVDTGEVTDPDLLHVQVDYENYRNAGAVLTKDSPLGPHFRTKSDIDYVNDVLDKFINGLKS